MIQIEVLKSVEKFSVSAWKSLQLKIWQLKIAKYNDKMYLSLNCVLLHLLKSLTWDTWSTEKKIYNHNHHKRYVMMPEGHKPNYNLI